MLIKFRFNNNNKVAFACDYLDFERIRLWIKAYVGENISISLDPNDVRRGYITEEGKLKCYFDIQE